MKKIFWGLALLAAVSSVARADGVSRNVVRGAVIGGAAGAIIGHSNRNTAQGVVIGAAAGALIGAAVDHRPSRTVVVQQYCPPPPPRYERQVVYVNTPPPRCEQEVVYVNTCPPPPRVVYVAPPRQTVVVYTNDRDCDTTTRVVVVEGGRRGDRNEYRAGVRDGYRDRSGDYDGRRGRHAVYVVGQGWR